MMLAVLKTVALKNSMKLPSFAPTFRFLSISDNAVTPYHGSAFIESSDQQQRCKFRGQDRVRNSEI
jgi:hypothetical protein